MKINPETFELQFQKTTVDDNGNWAVIARNQHGEMSQFFTFAAQMLPKFETKLSDQEGNEGKQVTHIFFLHITTHPCFIYNPKMYNIVRYLNPIFCLGHPQMQDQLPATTRN